MMKRKLLISAENNDLKFKTKNEKKIAFIGLGIMG